MGGRFVFVGFTLVFLSLSLFQPLPTKNVLCGVAIALASASTSTTNDIGSSSSSSSNNSSSSITTTSSLASNWTCAKPNWGEGHNAFSNFDRGQGGFEEFAFVKTHKTGSSTLSMLFLNYLAKHNKVMAIGKKGDLNFPKLFTVECLHDTSNVDAFLNHIVWSKDAATNVYAFLGRRVPTISILRDPLTRFVSSITYFAKGRQQLFKFGNFTQEQLERCYHHDKTTEFCIAGALDGILDAQEVGVSSLSVFYLYSYPTDLGLELYHVSFPNAVNRTAIPIHKTPALESALRSQLEMLETRLDLVLIMENWVESMVMLRHFMCLDEEDVLWWRQKQGRHMDPKQSYSDETLRKFQQVFWRDYIVYEWFLRKFKHQSQELSSVYGVDVRAEASHLMQVQKSKRSPCDIFHIADCCGEIASRYYFRMDVHQFMHYIYVSKREQHNTKEKAIDRLKRLTFPTRIMEDPYDAVCTRAIQQKIMVKAAKEGKRSKTMIERFACGEETWQSLFPGESPPTKPPVPNVMVPTLYNSNQPINSFICYSY
eukprot:m.33836 g.33836  ORF g.33836 m.33836 type:complete len:540 (+) comp6479_c0_seq1:121-1740(+)